MPPNQNLSSTTDPTTQDLALTEVNLYAILVSRLFDNANALDDFTFNPYFRQSEWGVDEEDKERASEAEKAKKHLCLFCEDHWSEDDSICPVNPDMVASPDKRAELERSLTNIAKLVDEAREGVPTAANTDDDGHESEGKVEEVVEALWALGDAMYDESGIGRIGYLDANSPVDVGVMINMEDAMNYHVAYAFLQ